MKALGVGLGFGECMHTWGVVEIGVCMSNTRKKRIDQITLTYQNEASNHEHKNRFMFYNAFHSTARHQLYPSPMLRSLDAQTLLKDHHRPSSAAAQCSHNSTIHIYTSISRTMHIHPTPLPFSYIPHTQKNDHKITSPLSEG